MILFRGDMRAVLSEMAPESQDGCLCDPPYELAFMGRSWDAAGVAFDVATWKPVLRVLKPGAHLLAFGGTRTYHRMACAIEDAGFEIRDCLGVGTYEAPVAGPDAVVLAWLYSTGFPKNLNVALAIDRLRGVESAEVSTGTSGKTRNVLNAAEHPESFGGEYAVKRAVSPEGQRWEGFGTALKPAWEPVVLARKPLREKSIAAQVLATGTGAINVDGCRVGRDAADKPGWATSGAQKDPEEARFGGHFYYKDAKTPEQIQAVASAGRWPPNAVFVHMPGCVPTGSKRVKSTANYGGDQSTSSIGYHGKSSGRPTVDPGVVGHDGKETVTDWKCAEGCPVAALGEQSGESESGFMAAGQKRNGSAASFTGKAILADTYGDSGTAARFFPQFHPFRYCAKPSRAERDAGLDGIEAKIRNRVNPGGLEHDQKWAPVKARNIHPTVKPVSLLEWAARLICPPGGSLLDPFTGSGSTGVAAVREGFRFVGVDLDQDDDGNPAGYLDIARARIEHARSPEPWELPLLADLAPEVPPPQPTLFEGLAP